MTLSKVDYFKRPNFFTGLLANSKFWNDIQDYHFNKEIFYNRMFHGSGVMAGVMEEYAVTPVKQQGALKILIGSGFACDGMGRGLFNYGPVAKIIDYRKYKLPATVYVVAFYHEVLDDFYQNSDNAEHQGYQKKIETVKIDITSDVPDNVSFMEIARIFLSEDDNGEIKGIDTPKDFAHPKPNEIDTRYVMWAKPANTGISPHLKKYVVSILDSSRNAAATANDVFDLHSLRDMQMIAMTGKMLMQCGDFDFRDIIHILNPLYDVNNYIVQEMLDYERENERRIFSSKDDFNVYRSKIHEMGDIVKYYDFKLETLDKLVKCQEEIINSLRNLIVTKKTAFADIAYISYEMPRILVIEDNRYTLVDYIDFADPKAELNNDFKVHEVKDIASSKDIFMYPDGVEVKDSIKRFANGEVSFNVRNLVRRRELMMIRRTDIFHGNYSVSVLLNSEHITDMHIDGFDSKHRWRNLLIQFPEDLISDNSVRISFRMGDSGRDNFGKMWFYQLL